MHKILQNITQSSTPLHFDAISEVPFWVPIKEQKN